MKKLLVAIFAIALFALPVFAEEIEFPSAKITIDVASGWEYTDDGLGTAGLVAPDKSASFTISRGPDRGGLGVMDIAVDLSRQTGGSKPVQSGGSCTFKFGDTNVVVTEDGPGYMAVAITGQHPQIPAMLNSVKDIE